MLGHNQLIQTRCFQGFEYCTGSVQDMDMSRTYGAPRRSDDIDVFHLAHQMRFEPTCRCVGGRVSPLISVVDIRPHTELLKG